MKVVRRRAEVREALAGIEDVGLVPTMGAFHEGHLELMRRARRSSACVAVSLFVNPTQFGPKEDLSRYPRQEDKDFRMAESVGVDLMFAPSVDEMYGHPETHVVVEGPALEWEGERRPGHFSGVATVVLKLLNLFGPSRAYFGLKDLQQCAVIRRMVHDLDVPVVLEFVETVREPDGLALSSRNVYLSSEERAKAPHLHRVLRECASKLKSLNTLDATLWQSLQKQYVAELDTIGFITEYLAAVDPYTMRPTTEPSANPRVIAAARLGSVRLIDNVAIEA